MKSLSKICPLSTTAKLCLRDSEPVADFRGTAHLHLQTTSVQTCMELDSDVPLWCYFTALAWNHARLRTNHTQTQGYTHARTHTHALTHARTRYFPIDDFSGADTLRPGGAPRPPGRAAPQRACRVHWMDLRLFLCTHTHCRGRTGCPAPPPGRGGPQRVRPQCVWALHLKFFQVAQFYIVSFTSFLQSVEKGRQQGV